jgi:hypothetical protein
MFFYIIIQNGCFFHSNQIFKSCDKVLNIFVRLKLLGETKINNELLICHKDLIDLL